MVMQPSQLGKRPLVCNMVSPYTVGVCVRSVFLTVLFLSISLSLFLLTYQALLLHEKTQQKGRDLSDIAHMKKQMGSIDFRLKLTPSPAPEATEEAVFEKPRRPKTRQPQSDPKHGDTSKILVHESHDEAKKRVLEKDAVYESCMEASQVTLDEIDIYFEDQWHLTYHGKHRHRQEVLRHGFFLNKTLVKNSLKKKKQCADYLHEIYSERLIMADIFRNLRHKDVSDEPREVTMMTQLSGNRLDKLLLGLDHWAGPASVVIFARSNAIRPITRVLCRNLLHRLKTNVKISLVLRMKEKYYPVNFLRNVALKLVDTPYVFLSDADFVPMATSHDVIRWHLDHLSLKHKGRVALVVPAFEAMPADPHKKTPANVDASTYEYPENKTVLLSQERRGLVEPFHKHFFPAAHMPTNFTKWRSASVPYRVHYGPYFEPYVVAATNAIPAYVEEFLGRQMNKVTHIRALHSKHFQFWVLPDVYTVHLPHEVERGPQDYWRCVNSIANLVMRKIQEDEDGSNSSSHENIPHIYKRNKLIADVDADT